MLTKLSLIHWMLLYDKNSPKFFIIQNTLIWWGHNTSQLCNNAPSDGNQVNRGWMRYFNFSDSLQFAFIIMCCYYIYNFWQSASQWKLYQILKSHRSPAYRSHCYITQGLKTCLISTLKYMLLGHALFKDTETSKYEAFSIV